MKPEPWRTVERDALEQVRADIAVVESMPIEAGTPVAWAECRFGRTDSLSVVHRAGSPIGETPMTLCSAVIPSAMLRLTLTPNLIRSLGRCKWCEAEYMAKGAAA